ncbi:MAG: hypothetical protein SGI72_14315 [Planctomycetota bacterium]|nr:hypothetical protein [Planctomycetota bacterium]
MSVKQGRIQSLVAMATAGLIALCVMTMPAHASVSNARVMCSETVKTQKFETAKEQFEHATSLKKALRGMEGEARDRARVDAVAAYRAVREYFASEAALCSEAAFRAGELLRTAEDLTGALAEFGVARERGAGTDFRVRAMLEIGHVERRAKHSQPALSAYEAVVSEDTASARQKDEALLWTGRVYADLERFADARRVWQKVADKGDDPIDRIHAFDEIASMLVVTGDLEGAAGVVKRCNEALADVSGEETKLGERVRASLAAMRSIDQLTRAIEKRKKADVKSEPEERADDKPKKEKKKKE